MQQYNVWYIKLAMKILNYKSIYTLLKSTVVEKPLMHGCRPCMRPRYSDVGQCSRQARAWGPGGRHGQQAASNQPQFRLTSAASLLRLL